MQKTLDDIIKEICQLREIKSINLDAILAYRYAPNEKLIYKFMCDLIGCPIFEWRQRKSKPIGLGQLKKVGKFSKMMIIQPEDLINYYTGEKKYKAKIGLRSDYYTYHEELRMFMEGHAYDAFFDFLCEKIELIDGEEKYKEDYLLSDESFNDLYNINFACDYEIEFPFVSLGVLLRNQ